MSKKRKIFMVLCVVVFFVVFILPIIKNDFDEIIYDKTFSILSNPDNKVYMDELVKYGRQNNINIEVSYADDLEAMDVLKEEEYDALWMSNSIWLYMLDGVKVINSKSISVNPVVMGIKKSKAETLGFVNNNIYNKDIMNAIKDGKLKYVMTSVTKTNTGLTAYLGFLNSLAGSPEILSMEMLDNEDLKNNLKSLFSGVERVSGSDTFLEDMFLSSDSYEAVIASESSLININKELVSNNKEPLYLLYPVDGVAINDGLVNSIHAEYPIYDTAKEIVDSAELIFSGTVKNISYAVMDVRTGEGIDSSTGLNERTGIPYSLYEIEIQKVYKGNEESKTITIKRPGGQYDGREDNLEDATVISQGESYLFLTKTFANSYPSLLNVSQASYDLNGKEKLSIEENTITLSQILEVLEQ